MNYQTALVQLPLVREVGKERVVSPADVHRVCADTADLAQETFLVICIDSKNRMLNRHMVSLGTVNSAPIGIADCFRGAISDSAVSVLLAHNHCSGDTTPSAEDIAVTKRLIEAGRIVGIRVVDHIIVGRNPDTGVPVQLSLRERGLCQFE